MIKKDLYIYPPILVFINLAILMLVGILFVKKQVALLDYISISAGGILVIIFIISLISTHKIEQARMKPEDVDILVTHGPYKKVRHPNFAGLICMNIAYLFFFRTLYLVPLICLFVAFWYLEARHEERVLKEKFGDSYQRYKESTAMFFPNLFH